MIWPGKKSAAPAAGSLAGPAAAPAAEAAPAPVAPKLQVAETSRMDMKTDLKVELHQNLLDRINLAALESMTREQVGRDIGDIVAEMLKEMNHALNLSERKQLVEDILDELLGLGPLEPLLKDASITEIMVNTAFIVFIERAGRIEETKARFADNRHLLWIIQKIVSGMGRRIDESSPMVDARLPDGSRVNAIIPPLAVDGPILTIRKFAKTPINME